VNSELLALYGLAMREAQRLERRLRDVSLVHQTAIKLLNGRTVGLEDFNQALAEGNGKTLGRLFRRYGEELGTIGARAPAPETVDEIVQLRNFLAHHYFERQRYRDGQTALPKAIRELPGNHIFGDEYLDDIQEAHPTAMAELRAAVEHLQGHVRILGGWLFRILEALGIQP
jgi:hypothetical protein